MGPMAQQSDDTNTSVEPTEEMAPASDMPVEEAASTEIPADGDMEEETSDESTEMPVEEAGEDAPAEETPAM